MVYKTWIRVFGLLLLLLPMWLVAQEIPARPNPPKPVSDIANLIPDGQEQSIDRKLRAYFDSTSTQIVVVTIPTLDGYAPGDIALKILREWGVGEKGKDNGIIFLVAAQERKVRIETGYGMEGSIPDGLAGTIIREQVIPSFKAGDYGQGIENGVDALILAASGEFVNDRVAESEGGGIVFIFIFLLFLIFVLYITYRMRQFGSGKGTVFTKRGYTDWDSGPRPPTIFWGGGGPWIGGGGMGGGGGDSGGGFDFGGGDGGGGGAEGSW